MTPNEDAVENWGKTPETLAMLWRQRLRHVVTSLHFSAVSSILLNGGHESDFATLRWPNNGMSLIFRFLVKRLPVRVRLTHSSETWLYYEFWRVLSCDLCFRQRHLINNWHILYYYFYFYLFLTNIEKNAKYAQSDTDPFIRELIDQKLALSPKERSIKFRKFSSKRNQPISPSYKQCSLPSLYFCVQLRNYVNNITFAINKYYPSQVWGFILDLHSIFVETSLKVNFGMEQ